MTYGFFVLESIFYFLYLAIEELANIKFGSKYSFDILEFFNDLNAKIAIGNSVQPNIIFLQLFLIK
tara:strand:+ start:801 stop:998 length:198 start_codon:yes stop_codon:yes gene_type:complete